MTLESRDQPSALYVPELDGAIQAAARHQPPVGTQCHAPNDASMALEGPEESPVRDAPDADLASGRTSRQERAISTQRHGWRVIDRLGGHRLRELTPSQAGILHLDILQDSLADRQTG